jgi:antitoxin component YwqK of YwqJK toxin-antitoxin module
MRLVPVLLLLCMWANAQKTEKFYDHNWKLAKPEHARYYTVIEHTDSVWLREDYYIHEKHLQMKGAYLDEATNIPDGAFFYYHSNGKLESAGSYTKGKKEGTWLSFHDDGSLSDSVPYSNGMIIGTSLGFHRNGYMADSTVINADGSGLSIRWYDNGQVSEAGRYAKGRRMHGRWQFFERTGRLTADETYDNGQLTKQEYYAPDGSLMDTTYQDSEAAFPGGSPAWKKFLESKIYWPTQYRFTREGSIVIEVAFEVSEEGKVVNVRVRNSFHPTFDKIAVDAIRHSPQWVPARAHNRNLPSYHTQPLTFVQTE